MGKLISLFLGNDKDKRVIQSPQPKAPAAPKAPSAPKAGAAPKASGAKAPDPMKAQMDMTKLKMSQELNMAKEQRLAEAADRLHEYRMKGLGITEYNAKTNRIKAQTESEMAVKEFEYDKEKDMREFQAEQEKTARELAQEDRRLAQDGLGTKVTAYKKELESGRMVIDSENNIVRNDKYYQDLEGTIDELRERQRANFDVLTESRAAMRAEPENSEYSTKAGLAEDRIIYYEDEIRKLEKELGYPGEEEEGVEPVEETTETPTKGKTPPGESGEELEELVEPEAPEGELENNIGTGIDETYDDSFLEDEEDDEEFLYY